MRLHSSHRKFAFVTSERGGIIVLIRSVSDQNPTKNKPELTTHYRRETIIIIIGERHVSTQSESTRDRWTVWRWPRAAAVLLHVAHILLRKQNSNEWRLTVGSILFLSRKLSKNDIRRYTRALVKFDVLKCHATCRYTHLYYHLYTNRRR